MFVVEPQDDQHLQGANRRRRRCANRRLSREDWRNQLAELSAGASHGKSLPFPNVERLLHTGSELEPGVAIPDVRPPQAAICGRNPAGANLEKVGAVFTRYEYTP
jgi:hypothetical protein